MSEEIRSRNGGVNFGLDATSSEPRNYQITKNTRGNELELDSEDADEGEPGRH